MLEDASIDAKRLPKAIQAILSNHRGARVSSVPERAIPDVLRRLAEAAELLGRMPHQGETAEVYEMLAQVLKQASFTHLLGQRPSSNEIGNVAEILGI